MEKLLVLILLCQLAEGQQTRHIETAGSGSGDWFQSTGIRITGSNQLVFQAKGSRDAILGLCTRDTDDSRRWDIVVGGHGNTKDTIRFRIQNEERGYLGCPRRSLSQTEYRTFWLSWDHRSIRLGDGDTVGENQYCEQTSTDRNTPTDFYLRLGSYKQNTVNWIIHLPTTTPTTTVTDVVTTAPTTTPTTFTMPAIANDVTTATNSTDVSTSSSNVVSIGLCQMTIIVLRLVLP